MPITMTDEGKVTSGAADSDRNRSRPPADKKWLTVAKAVNSIVTQDEDNFWHADNPYSWSIQCSNLNQHTNVGGQSYSMTRRLLRMNTAGAIMPMDGYVYGLAAHANAAITAGAVTFAVDADGVELSQFPIPNWSTGETRIPVCAIGIDFDDTSFSKVYQSGFDAVGRWGFDPQQMAFTKGQSLSVNGWGWGTLPAGVDITVSLFLQGTISP